MIRPADPQSLGPSFFNLIEAYVLTAIRRKHSIGLPTIRELLERVERDPRGLPIKLYPLMRSEPPREQPRTVVIDPQVSFGRPVLADTAIPSAVLAEQFKVGQPNDLARKYGADDQAVWDAIRFEFDLQRAA